MLKNQRNTIHIGGEVSPELELEVRILAARLRISRSELIRRALKDYLVSFKDNNGSKENNKIQEQ